MINRVCSKLFIATLSLCAAFNSNTSGQEKFGNTFNVGLGLGYYGYLDHSLPVLHFNYEFDVAKNFTLAPFITFYSYRDYVFWGDPGAPYKDYYYRETV